MSLLREALNEERAAVLRAFVARLLDPDDLGHAVSGEVRRLARQALDDAAPVRGAAPEAPERPA